MCNKKIILSNNSLKLINLRLYVKKPIKKLYKDNLNNVLNFFPCCTI